MLLPDRYRSRRAVVFAAMLAAIAAAPAHSALESVQTDAVWCFPEYHRIDPVSSAVAELGFAPVPAEFKRSNSVYKADANEVLLLAMKGETVAFQLMIEGAHKDVTVELAGMPGRTELFYEGYLPVHDAGSDTARYAPDVALPMDWVGGRFDVRTPPAPLPAVPHKRMQALWIDVRVPRDARAGITRGHLSVTAAGRPLARIVVTLRIADLAIPARPSYLLAIIQYGMFARKRPELRADAFARMQAHRLSIHDLPYASQRGWAYEGAVPRTTLSPVFERCDKFLATAQKMNDAARRQYRFLPALAPLRKPSAHSVSGDALRKRLRETMPMHDMLLREATSVYRRRGAGITDWTGFDRLYGPVLDGSAFDDRIPIASFELPFNFNWPAPLDRFEIKNPKQSEMYEDIWVKVARDFLAHANERGWTQTQFFVYFNPKDRGNNLVMWKGDEPVEHKDFLAHRYFHGLFQKAFAEPGAVKVDYKIEVGHWECDAAHCPKRGRPDKTWDESNARAMLEAIRVWVPSTSHYDPARKIAWRQIAEEHDVFYTYGSLPSYDQSAMAIYGIACQAFEDRTSGRFFYAPRLGRIQHTQLRPDPKAQQPANSQAVHYDPTPFGKSDKMLMSLRLKTLRGVEQHYAAFLCAAAKNKRSADELNKSLSPDEDNPAELYAARIKAIGIAAAQRNRRNREE